MANRYGLAIRALDAGEIDGVAQLLHASNINIPQDKLGARHETMRTQPGVVLIAEEWGPPTGLIALTWSARLDSDLKAAEVTSLLVAPERRRNGVARLLLKAASQAARVAGCGELVLNTGGENGDLSAFASATALAIGLAIAGHRLTRPLRKQG